MKSKTKVSLSPQDLERITLRTFGPGAVLARHQEITDGWFNTLHSLELEDGRRFAVKVGPRPGVPVLRYEEGLLPTEVAVYRLLAGVPGVPVPRVHGWDFDDPDLPQGWFVMDWAGDTTAAAAKEALPEALRPDLDRDLGRVNRALNRITGPAFGSVEAGGFRSPAWSEVVLRLASQVLADAADAGTALPRPPGAILALFEGARPDLDLVREPRLVHWDLHDRNAFSDGNRITAVIDGDRALWGDPLMELFFRSFMDSRAFLEGYGTEVLAQPGAGRRRAVYDLYLALVMTVECDFRGFDDPGHRAWVSGNLQAALAALEGRPAAGV